MKKKALFIATSMTVSSPLLADDFEFYAGGMLSQVKIDVRVDFQPPRPFTGTYGDDSDLSLQLLAGARKPIGRYFYGAEVAYGTGGPKAAAAFVQGNSLTGQRGEIEESSSIGISGVGGFEWTPNLAILGRLGYLRTTFDYQTLEGSTVFADGDESFSDFEIAIGVEYRLSDRLSLRAELSQIDYSDHINDVANGTGDLARFDDVSRDAISIGVFAKF
jgi:opacity protein-like surface antigen